MKRYELFETWNGLSIHESYKGDLVDYEEAQQAIKDAVAKACADERERIAKLIYPDNIEPPSDSEWDLRCFLATSIRMLKDEPPVWTAEMIKQVNKDAEMMASKMKALPEAE